MARGVGIEHEAVRPAGLDRVAGREPVDRIGQPQLVEAAAEPPDTAGGGGTGGAHLDAFAVPEARLAQPGVDVQEPSTRTTSYAVSGVAGVPNRALTA